jgi:hypothetical protein
MIFKNWSNTNELAVQQIGKFAVYVSISDCRDTKIWDTLTQEVKKLFPESDAEARNCLSCLIDGGLFFFDTELEAREFYSKFYSSLRDLSRIFVVLYNSTGKTISDDTMV